MTTRRAVLAGTTVAATGALLGKASAAGAESRPEPRPTIVLIHGAFADASGWNDVADRLIRDDYPVIAPANPLRGVSSDSAYVAAILATITGPVVVAAHSTSVVERNRVYNNGWPRNEGVDVLGREIELQVLYPALHNILHVRHEFATHHVLPVVE